LAEWITAMLEGAICWLDSKIYLQTAFLSILGLFRIKRLILLKLSKTFIMKRILAFLLLVSFLSACTQYTCPTYSNKEVKKTTANRI
jgi:hypothetical protein